MREWLAKQGDTTGNMRQNVTTPTRKERLTYARISKVSHVQVLGETDGPKLEANTKTGEGGDARGGKIEESCVESVDLCRTSASGDSTNKSLEFLLKLLQNE